MEGMAALRKDKNRQLWAVEWELWKSLEGGHLCDISECLPQDANSQERTDWLSLGHGLTPWGWGL